MDPLVNTQNCFKVFSSSEFEFREKVDALMLDAPEWVALHAATVRTYLDGMPPSLINYTYAPKVQHQGVIIKFKCSEKSFKLTLKKELIPDCISQILQNSDQKRTQNSSGSQPSKIQMNQENMTIYKGPITSESLQMMPENMQEMTKKYANSSFPYTADIKSNGNVTIGGSVSFVGRTVSLADLMKEMGLEGNR